VFIKWRYLIKQVRGQDVPFQHRRLFLPTGELKVILRSHVRKILLGRYLLFGNFATHHLGFGNGKSIQSLWDSKRLKTYILALKSQLLYSISQIYQTMGSSMIPTSLDGSVYFTSPNGTAIFRFGSLWNNVATMAS